MEEIRVEISLNWYELKDYLWCCDYEIDQIEKHEKIDELMQYLIGITFDEPIEITKLNDFIRFNSLEFLEIEEE